MKSLSSCWSRSTHYPKQLLLLAFVILFVSNGYCSVESGQSKTATKPSTGGGRDKLIQITDDNWSQILEGEWMVEFFAPWCPACKNLQPVWEEFATWSDDLDISVGQIDVTNSPGLSGRFMITALPTIYHVIDGQFRQYRSPRTKEDLLSFVEEKKWEAVEPISSWQSPASFQMSLLSQFYKISMGLRNLMNKLTQEYGLPYWSTYLIFGGGTICIGLILGLILVCIIDCIYPPAPKRASTISSADPGAGEPASPQERTEEEKVEDEIVDDEDDEQADDEEDEKGLDSEEVHSSQEEGSQSHGDESEDKKSSPKPSSSSGDDGGTRKRRVRKAD